MTIYNVIDQLDRDYGSYSTREQAVCMAELLKIWYADGTYYVKEVCYDLDKAA